MTGQRLILNDGTTIENGRAGYSQGFLWCHFKDFTMQQAAAIFLDEEKTSKIVFQYGEMQDEYNGFTSCIRLLIDVDGLVSVCMERGENDV